MLLPSKSIHFMSLIAPLKKGGSSKFLIIILTKHRRISEKVTESLLLFVPANVRIYFDIRGI
jgi:hypothetical protein